MRTFFIYDTAYCKAEEDDPKDAVLFFYPLQNSDSQCYSLCCQIVGVTKFLRSTFSCPSIITLEHDKFALHWSGKYLFVLGRSEDTHDSVLKQELSFLCGIFCFYHGSINNIMKACKHNRQEFLDRMELAWSRNIALYECFNNLLNVPVNPVPLPFVKKYSETVSRANELLRMCQLSASVIAGAVYCNNRVLSSQLIPELTSYLTLMSNENASSPVPNVITPFKNLPPNVELKYVYLSQRTLQSIIKHNHLHVGSYVRVKVDEKMQVSQSPNYCGSVTSGSEGDVDSGHCTEIVYQRQKGNTLNFTKNQMPYSEFSFKNQLLCCSMHAEIFKKDLLKCRNKIFKKYLNLEFITEKMKHFEKRKISQINVDVTRSKFGQKGKKSSIAENKIFSYNLLCHHHANIFSTNFLYASTYDHENFSSACDLEYSCYFCINHRFSVKSTPLSVKRWNSEMHIPDYLYLIPQKPLIHDSAFNGDKLKKCKASRCKIQILKCRTKANVCAQCTRKPSTPSHHSKKHCSEHAMYDKKYRSSKHSVQHLPQSTYSSIDYWGNMESNDLEKCLLYVQRFENNMVVLLLNRNLDENILTYLWNCSFTFLKDLEYHEEKIKENFKVDSQNYILIYDNVKKVLKERTHNDAAMFAEKHVKNSVQAIQEDFQSNPKLHLFSLLSANQNVYACQTKQQFAFCLQQDFNPKKPDSLSSLSKKAAHRLEKYVNSI